MGESQKGVAQFLLILILSFVSIAGIGYYAFKNGQIKIIPQEKTPLDETAGQATNSDMTNWTTYTNDKFHYSFAYPTSATLYENVPQDYIVATPGSNFLELRIPHKNSTYNIDFDPNQTYKPRYPETEMPEFKNLRDYVEYLHHIEGKSIPKQNIPYDIAHDFTHKLLAFDNLTVGNKPAVYLRTEPLPNQGVALEMGFNVAYIEYQPGKILYLSGLPPYFEEETNLLHKILSTFEFVSEDWTDWELYKSDELGLSLRLPYNYGNPTFTSDGVQIHTPNSPLGYCCTVKISINYQNIDEFLEGKKKDPRINTIPADSLKIGKFDTVHLTEPGENDSLRHHLLLAKHNDDLVYVSFNHPVGSPLRSTSIPRILSSFEFTD